MHQEFLFKDALLTFFLVMGLVVCSGFASSSETAFFSLNRFQLRKIKERYPEAYQRISKLLQHPSRLLVLILFINEFVNFSISTLTTQYLQHHTGIQFLHPQWLYLSLTSMAISIPLLLILGEISPKLIATKMNRFIAILNSKPLMFFYKLFYPVLWVLDFFINSFLKRIKAEGKDPLSKNMQVLSEEDFVLLMEQGHKEGTVDPAEKKLINNVFEFDDSTVSEVMTPIQQAFCVRDQQPVYEILNELKNQRYSRVPVYCKSKKKIVGILYLKDLLTTKTSDALQKSLVVEFMAKPFLVSPSMRLSTLFRKFKEQKLHMAIVAKENSEAIGVVTMDDVLESIFGEIADERDQK